MHTQGYNEPSRAMDTMHESVCVCVCVYRCINRKRSDQTITEKYVTNLEFSGQWWLIWLVSSKGIFPFGPLLSIRASVRLRIRAHTRSTTRTVCTAGYAKECLATVKNSAFHLYSLLLFLFYYFMYHLFLCAWVLLYGEFVFNFLFLSEWKQPSDKLFMTYEHNGIHDSSIPNTYR